jgi:hypothetical protein
VKNNTSDFSFCFASSSMNPLYYLNPIMLC